MVSSEVVVVISTEVAVIESVPVPSVSVEVIEEVVVVVVVVRVMTGSVMVIPPWGMTNSNNKTNDEKANKSV